jgi:hypothetical protein
MKPFRTDNSRTQSSKPCGLFNRLVVVSSLLAVLAIPALAQRTAGGVVVNEDNERVGTWETYRTTGNPCNCWARLWLDGGRVLDVLPSRWEGSNLRGTFIEYRNGVKVYAGETLTLGDGSGKFNLRYTKEFGTPTPSIPINGKWIPYRLTP